MANYSLEIGSALSTGWEYAKKYGLLVAVIYLLIGVVTSGLQNILGSSISPDVYQGMSEAMARGDWDAVAKYANAYNNGMGQYIGLTFSSIIDIVISVALYNLALGLMSGRFSEVTFDAFKLPAATYLKVVAVEIIVGIIICFSLLCCFIPFFFVTPRLIMAPLYQIENPEAGVFDSIKASWNMTSGNTLSLLGLGIAIVGIIFVGFCCCCIGVYFAQAIELFALIAAYYQLKNNLY